MWPFEGRQSELALLRSAFATGEVDTVLVSAAAGVGKTRLAREAITGLGAQRTAWATATRAAATIPFAAVAPLLPDAAASGGSVEVIRATARRLAGWGGRREVAVVVDDAHLLDDASAALVAHLARERLAFVVMNVRVGEPVADAVLRLVRDGRGEQLTLDPLRDADMDRLIDHAAAGTAARVRRRLRRVAAGNPLALRELLHGSQPGGLTELVVSRLDSLEPDVRFVVELTACGEPLPVPVLDRLVGADAVVRAEDTGLVVVERSGRRRLARLDHPLYGEVLSSRMTVSRLVRTYDALADALLATPMRRRGDALQAAVWQVESGTVRRPDVLRAGALKAVGHSELEMAERLARAARQAEPGIEADRLLAEILAYRGQSAEAAQILATTTAPADPAQRVSWAVTRAEAVYWGDGGLDAALAMLDIAGDDPLARASRSWLLFFDGRCVPALDLADAVVDDPCAEPKARVWAAASGCAAAGFLGRDAHAARTYQRAVTFAAAHAEALPWGPVQVDTGMSFAHLAGGRPTAAQSISTTGYQAALEGGAAMMVCGWALYGGLAALARGHLDDAQQLLAEAGSGFELNDTFRLRRVCLAARAAAMALGGRRDASRLMADADALVRPSNKVFDPWIAGWRAWIGYAQRDLGAATAAARASADLAREAGMPGVEALALYDLTRLGAPLDLARLDAIDHEIGHLAAGAARALAARDGACDLEEAARRLHDRGFDLLAAELYCAAGRRHRRYQRWADCDLARARAIQLSAAFPRAQTPLLQPGDLITLLTFRERQILLLAAEHTSADIAGRLRLAVATVNNNLARAYQKLGISGRSQLRELLDDPADPTYPATSYTPGWSASAAPRTAPGR